MSHCCDAVVVGGPESMRICCDLAVSALPALSTEAKRTVVVVATVNAPA